MFGSTFGGGKIDSIGVELNLTCLVPLEYNWFCPQNCFYLKLEIVTSDSRVYFHTQMYCSTQLHIKISNINQFTQNHFFTAQSNIH